MLRISKSSNFIIQTLEADNDPLHFLIKSIPSISMTAMVRKLKKKSTVSVWKTFFPFLQKHVFLELFVKVSKEWRNNENQLRRFGYIFK